MHKNIVNKIDKFMSFFYEVSLYLLIFATTTLIVTNILFICKVSITSLHLPLGIILSAIIYYILRKEKKTKSLLPIFVGIITFFILTFGVGMTYDSTADGNTYHKLAVGAMKNGWNPTYETVADFNKDKGNPFDVYEDNVNVNWVDHYAKGTETFGAVVYAATNKIERGKVFNILFLFIGFFLLYNIFKQMKVKPIKSLFLAGVLAFNPISLVQLSNFYLDGVLGISLFIIILLCLLPYNKKTYKDNYLILAMCIIWCINAKFTGLAYSAIFCLVLYLYRHIKNFLTNKELFKPFIIKETIYYIVVVIVSVLIVGSGSYTKNFIDHGHPLYPLYGKNHVPNMVMMEIPTSMQNDSSLKLFLTSIFAKGENVSPSYVEQTNEAELKIPLTTSKEEINNYATPDIRMGGFGPLFSAIFILTVIGTIFMLFKLIKKKDYDRLIPYLIVLITTFSLILFLDGSYWARYIPYAFLLPIYVLIYFFQTNSKKLINILCFVTILIFIANALLITAAQLNEMVKSRNYLNYRKERFIEDTNKSNVEIRLRHHGAQGVLYNIDDWHIDNYTLTDDESLKDAFDVYMFTYDHKEV